MPKWVYRGALIILVLAAAVLLLKIALQPSLHGWDFRTYHAAARTVDAGESPYDEEALRRNGFDVKFPFLYPPLTIVFFMPIADWTHERAHTLWWGIRFLFLVWLLYSWKQFMRDDTDLFFWVFLFTALGTPIHLDFRAGNTAIIEAAFIWYGFLALRESRAGPFVLAILASSVFRWMPVVFLPLVLMTSDARRVRWLSLGLSGFAVHLALQFWIQPEWMKSLFQVAAAHDERGDAHNPSLLSFGRDLMDRFPASLQSSGASAAMSIGLYFVLAITIIWLTWLVWNRRSSVGHVSMNWVIVGACLTYALTVPRLKTYSLMLILPPAYMLIKRIKPAWIAVVIYMAFAWAPVPSIELVQSMGHEFWYTPLALTLFLWVLWALKVLPSHNDGSPPIDNVGEQAATAA